jgi:thiamine pyrophosphate-dependent acetolactate synthase large subunit-like protein
MREQFSPLFAAADGLLAVGCRFTQLATGSWTWRPPPSIAQIDIDATEIGRHYPVQCGIVADAAATLRQLLDRLPNEPRRSWAPPALPSSAPWALPAGQVCPSCSAPMKLRPGHNKYFLGCSQYPKCRETREVTPELLGQIAAAPREPWRLPGIDLLAVMQRLLPRDTILSADVTRLGYILMAEYPLTQPRTWLHPSGSVAMGFGIPAALGAKAAFPQRTVVAVVGDGCFMMSALELASSRQEALPIIVILVNDNALSLIKATQQRRYAGRFIGVDLLHPDFRVLAQAFGVGYWRAEDDTAFEAGLSAALASGQTAIIEVRPSK